MEIFVTMVNSILPNLRWQSKLSMIPTKFATPSPMWKISNRQFPFGLGSQFCYYWWYLKWREDSFDILANFLCVLINNKIKPR